jgi:hypothetical protein
MYHIHERAEESSVVMGWLGNLFRLEFQKCIIIHLSLIIKLIEKIAEINKLDFDIKFIEN